MDWYIFFVPKGDAKHPSKVELYKNVPTLLYQQHECNIYCFSRLDADFVVLGYLVSSKATAMRIITLLLYYSHDYIDRIKFANVIMVRRKRKKG